MVDLTDAEVGSRWVFRNGQVGILVRKQPMTRNRGMEAVVVHFASEPPKRDRAVYLDGRSGSEGMQYELDIVGPAEYDEPPY